jgi:hypothetical protein
MHVDVCRGLSVREEGTCVCTCVCVCVCLCVSIEYMPLQLDVRRGLSVEEKVRELGSTGSRCCVCMCAG